MCPPDRRQRGLWGAVPAFLLLVLGREVAAQRVAVARFDERDGLPQSQVTSLCRDRDGFLWVATKNGGLARFDGSRFVRPDPRDGFADRIVGPLHLGATDGALWVGGPALYVKRGRRFTRVLAQPVDAIAEGAGGRLWAGGGQGLYEIIDTAKEIRVRRLDPRPVTALSAGADGLWVGHLDGLERVPPLPAPALAGHSVWALLATANGVLAGTSAGLQSVGRDGIARAVSVPLPDPRVDTLLPDAQGRPWAGTMKGPVRLSADLSREELAPRDGLPGVRILSFATGEGGEIWMGADGAGLFRFAPSRFSIVESEAGLVETIPLSMAPAPDGALWITTARGEIARLDRGAFRVFGTVEGLPLTDRFRDLVVAADGRIDATWSRGIVRRGAGEERFHAILFAGNERPTGLALAPGPDGAEETWIATTAGLRVVRHERIQRPATKLFGDRPVESIGRDGDGLLVASAGAVFSVDPVAGIVVKLADVASVLALEQVWHLMRGPDGAVWALSVRGAVRIDPDGSLRLLNAASGLPDDSVDAASSDGNVVWLSTDRGLVRLSPKGNILRVYGLADGLPALEGIVRSVCRDAVGRLWFGFVGALIRYDPSAEEAAPPPPRAYVETFSVGDRRRGRRETAIALGVIDFADARGATLAWKLEPHDIAFSRPQEARTARWASLPPGDYVFHAIALDRTGRAGPEATISFRIPPLWYETTWARVLALLVLLAAGTLVPAGLRAGLALVNRTQALAAYLAREILSPGFRPIDDDPFAPGAPLPPLAQAEAVARIREVIAKSWQRHAILALAGLPGGGKTTLLRSLEEGAAGERVLVVPIPPLPFPRRHEALAHELAIRGLTLPASDVAASDSAVSLTRSLSALARQVAERDIDLLLLEHDSGEHDSAVARSRALFASALLQAAPRVSLLVCRDVPPSALAAEEPDLARTAALIELRPAAPEEGGAWLVRVCGDRARFVPGVAAHAVREIGGDPVLVRAFGSALLECLKQRRVNRVTRGVVREVLIGWDRFPPPALVALWVRLSAAERLVGAALGQIDRGEGELRPIGQLVEALRAGPSELGPMGVGALVDRLVEARVLTRELDRVAFSSPLLSRFVARHRPLSEEQVSGSGVVGAYELLHPVGSGGMGTVYFARRLDNHAEVAVKVVHPHLVSTGDARRRFLLEGEIGGRLSHPGIVRVFERGESGGRAFIAMEYVSGPTLREVVKRRGPFPVRLALRLARDVADALATIHAAGIVHRDLKSENIILGPGAAPKLLDFGLARLMEATRHTQSGHAIGTPEYMAPEQVHGDAPTSAADIWSLGIALYEMLAGVTPFRRPDARATFHAILDLPAKPVSELRPELPSEVCRIVTRALEKDPASRWPSAEAFRDALDAVLGTLAEEPVEAAYLDSVGGIPRAEDGPRQSDSRVKTSAVPRE